MRRGCDKDARHHEISILFGSFTTENTECTENGFFLSQGAKIPPHLVARKPFFNSFGSIQKDGGKEMIHIQNGEDTDKEEPLVNIQGTNTAATPI